MNDMETFESFVKSQERLYTIDEGSVVGSQVQYILQFLRDHPDIHEILEIGFNGGLSSAAMMSARPDIHVISFDIGRHAYVAPAKQLIDEVFGANRHHLILGDSTQTLPEFARTSLPGVFDFAFIDGGHIDPVPHLDISHAMPLVRDGGYVFVDDYCDTYGSEGVISAYDAAVASGYLKTYQGPFSGEGGRGWIVGRLRQQQAP
jgi:predicted O-methyltransferase YrrM